MSTIKPGVYKHYKGKEYLVLGVGRHSETLEDMVIYKPQYDSDVDFWVRPLAMFNDVVDLGGKKVLRFKKKNK